MFLLLGNLSRKEPPFKRAGRAVLIVAVPAILQNPAQLSPEQRLLLR